MIDVLERPVSGMIGARNCFKKWMNIKNIRDQIFFDCEKNVSIWVHRMNMEDKL